MPSPFPGMDPFLEDPGLWPDVHHRLISVLADRLRAEIRPRYVARIAVRAYDLGFLDEIEESRVEIRDRESGPVVTVIEVLSPENKLADSAGRTSFVTKRNEVSKSPSHWVEIDLLRGGLGFLHVPGIPLCEYAVHVSRADRRYQAAIWPIRLPQRLPVVAIPLKAGDDDAKLDLQAVLATVYDRAGYDMQLDYRREPVPPLPPEWAAWADALLKEKGLRSA